MIPLFFWSELATDESVHLAERDWH